MTDPPAIHKSTRTPITDDIEEEYRQEGPGIQLVTWGVNFFATKTKLTGPELVDNGEETSLGYYALRTELQEQLFHTIQDLQRILNIMGRVSRQREAGYSINPASMLSCTLNGTDSLPFLNAMWHLLWVKFCQGENVYNKYIEALQEGEFTLSRSPVLTDPGLYNELLLLEDPEERLKQLLMTILSYNRTIVLMQLANYEKTKDWTSIHAVPMSWRFIRPRSALEAPSSGEYEGATPKTDEEPIFPKLSTPASHSSLLARADDMLKCNEHILMDHPGIQKDSWFNPRARSISTPPLAELLRDVLKSPSLSSSSVKKSALLAKLNSPMLLSTGSVKSAASTSVMTLKMEDFIIPMEEKVFKFEEEQEAAHLPINNWHRPLSAMEEEEEAEFSKEDKGKGKAHEHNQGFPSPLSCAQPFATIGAADQSTNWREKIG